LSFEKNPVTWPGVDGKVVYEEGTVVGYRWYLEHKVEPQWWFGHGLEYTTFNISDLQVRDEVSQTGWDISLRVENTGQTAGQHVVQVYTNRKDCDNERELRSFEKSAILAPGESQVLPMKIKARDMAHWQDGKWALDAGEYTLSVSENAGGAQLLIATVSLPQSMTWDP
jgi:beta-glucosidase